MNAQAPVEQQASTYIPADWRLAIAEGVSLPEHTEGAGLVADIPGFTPLAEALKQARGLRRGAEELASHLNLVYDALIAEVDPAGVLSVPAAVPSAPAVRPSSRRTGR